MRGKKYPESGAPMHERPELFDEIDRHLIDGTLALGPRLSGWMSRRSFLAVVAAGICCVLTGGGRPYKGLANCPAMFARKLHS